MEVLNRNQRRSAIWRLIGLGILVLLGISTVLYSAHAKYANQGQGDIEKLKRDHQKELNSWIAKHRDLYNKNTALKKEIKLLKIPDNKPDDRLKALQDRLELRQDRIKDLEADLTRCQSNSPQGSSNGG